MHRRLLASALALTSGLSFSQTLTLTQTGGGAFRSLAASADRVLAANSSGKLFEVRGAGLTEVAVATLTAPGLAVSSVNNDIRITAIDSGKSVTVGGRGIDIPTRAFATREGFYILGTTDSPDFPVTNASRPRGGLDGFLLRLDIDLNTIYATYLGGAGTDEFSDLAVDASGSAYVVASSNSAELAVGARGFPAYLSFGLGFDPIGGAFRATVQAWLAPNENTLFAATAGQGIFRSTDQGQSWTTLNLADLNVTALAGDAQTIYAGTPRALHRSTNGGTSWSEVPVSASGSGIRALAAVPRDRNILYASLLNGCGLFRSSDGGRTFQTQLDVCISALAVNDTAVFAFSPTNGVYQSTTTGGPWTRVSTTLLNTRAASFDGTALYAATSTGLSKSDDNGRTWTEVFASTTITCVSGSTIGTSDQGILRDGVRLDDAAVQQPVRSLLVTSNLIAAGTDYLPDVYVAKISPRGDQILFSTFLGGRGTESSARIALDNAGGIVVGATTDSADLIATFEGVQRRYAGGLSDLFLAKLNGNFDLTSLTYFGGSAQDSLGGIAVNATNFVHIVGTTASPEFAPGPSGFLAVLSPGLGSMSNLTAVGRTGEAIAVQADNVWIGGGQGEDDGYIAQYTGLVRFGAITAIRNGASLLTGPIAPSSNVVIEGSGFGSSLFGLTVRFGQTEASVVRASDTRLEVVAPADLEPGTSVPVSVTSRTGSFQGSAVVAAVSPGLFSANRDGRGVAQALLLRLDNDGVTTTTAVYECDINDVCVAVPIDLGDEDDQLSLILRATGIRGRRESIAVDMNGTSAEVLSANALDEFSGVDQIVVKLPRTLTGEVTIRVTVDGQPANPVTIRIL